MGREVRHVPPNWQHPKDSRGHYIPMHGRSFYKTLTEWEEGSAKWSEGLRKNYATGEWVPKPVGLTDTFVEWSGPRPDASHYMPNWPESERTHIQMYEDCTEGTPISPVMDTPEHLARWLADNGASAFGDDTARYEAWLATIRRGWAVSAVGVPGVGLVSGVTDNLKE
jgi:hypothetical protein